MVRLFPLVALCACAPVPLAPAEGDGDALQFGASGIALDVGTPHPGGIVEVVVTGAAPGESVWVYVSNGGIAPNAGPCNSTFGSLCLDLGSGTSLAGTVAADGSGVAALVIPVAQTKVPGRKLTYQAAIRRGFAGNASVKTNPAARTIGPPVWESTPVVDGSLADWGPDELFTTTSADGSAGGVTWDADSLYVAFDHSDVAGGGPLHWQIVYVGTGAPGSTVGTVLNTQTPALPFEASVVLRRKADGSYDDLLVWNDVTSTWDGTPYWLGTEGSAAAEAGNGLEIAIPRAVVDGWTLEVALAQVYEGSGFESTYAGVPADAFADGYDPDLATSLLLDLSTSDAPAVQNP